MVPQFNYLGMVFESSGKWDSTIERLVTQANKATMGLRKKMSRFLFNPADKYRLFLQMIEPITSYGCEVWGYYSATSLEKIHVCFLRQILKARKSACTTMLYCELGTSALIVRRHSRLLSYWCTLMVENQRKMSSRIYRMARQEGANPWCTAVKGLCKKYALQHLWEENIIAKDRLQHVQSTVKDTVWKWNQEKLHREMVGGKADFYRELMPICKKGALPWYLTHLEDRHCRTLSRFRMRCHGLMIDCGAWIGLDREERLCVHCGVVDNEEHFLFACSLVSDLREKYLLFAISEGTVAEVYTLLKSEDKHVLDNLCIFITKGLLKVEKYYDNLLEVNNLVRGATADDT